MWYHSSHDWVSHLIRISIVITGGAFNGNQAIVTVHRINIVPLLYSKEVNTTRTGRFDKGGRPLLTCLCIEHCKLLEFQWKLSSDNVYIPCLSSLKSATLIKGGHHKKGSVYLFLGWTSYGMPPVGKGSIQYWGQVMSTPKSWLRASWNSLQVLRTELYIFN